ncbi:MAG: hypothetical protein ACKPKO_33575, partial [Candidatus Fonsibacter sp.]
MKHLPIARLRPTIQDRSGVGNWQAPQNTGHRMLPVLSEQWQRRVKVYMDIPDIDVVFHDWGRRAAR